MSRLPDPDCPLCKGFGIRSVPVNKDTARLVECECIQDDQES